MHVFGSLESRVKESVMSQIHSLGDRANRTVDAELDAVRPWVLNIKTAMDLTMVWIDNDDDDDAADADGDVDDYDDAEDDDDDDDDVDDDDDDDDGGGGGDDGGDI